MNGKEYTGTGVYQYEIWNPTMYPSKPGQSHDFMSRFVFFCFTGLNLTFVDAITMTWYEAKAVCENMNSHLVEIFSEAQQTIIKELAKS